MSAKILIVEDEPIIAKDIELYLDKLGYKVIGVAHDSETALDMLHSRSPDLVLLDISIEGSRDGIDIAHIVNEKYKIPFLFLTSYSDESTLGRAKETRPFGYIVKPFDERDLKTAITIALFNYKAKEDDKDVSKSKLDALCLTALSEKEFKVIKDLIQGLNSAQIAEKHFVSVNTVKFHLKNIYQKMEVSGKTELLSKVMNS